MTQAEVKAAIDAAFCDGVGKIFGVLVADIDAPNAERAFHAGLERYLRAHAMAISVAEQVIGT